MSDVDTHAEDAIGEHALSQWGAGNERILPATIALPVRPVRSRPTPRGLREKAELWPCRSWRVRRGCHFMRWIPPRRRSAGEWRLPVVAELRDGQLMVIEHFNGEDAFDDF